MFKRTIIILIALPTIVALGYTRYTWTQWHETPLPLSEARTIHVEPGTSLSALAIELANNRIINHSWELKLLARLDNNANRIQAGEYRIQPGTTLAGLLDQLVQGDVLLHSFTIIEGMNWKQLRARLNENEFLDHQSRDLTDAEIMQQLGLDGVHPEGQFLPETYRFARGTSDIEFLRRANNALTVALDRLWQERDNNLPLASRYDALILASIVEKETSLAEERERIAGVFVRRLERGMRLQTDPTVIYGLGDEYDGDIRFRHLREDNPYNTYTRSGLPPTPICMTGVDSIRAALHPAPGDEIYFVASGDGGHVFSSTLEEHNRAVRRYLQGGK